MRDYFRDEDVLLIAQTKPTVTVVTPHVHEAKMHLSDVSLSLDGTYPWESRATLCCGPHAMSMIVLSSSPLTGTFTNGSASDVTK
jgi:hypothetical protein